MQCYDVEDSSKKNRIFNGTFFNLCIFKSLVKRLHAINKFDQEKYQGIQGIRQPSYTFSVCTFVLRNITEISIICSTLHYSVCTFLIYMVSNSTARSIIFSILYEHFFRVITALIFKNQT